MNPHDEGESGSTTVDGGGTCSRKDHSCGENASEGYSSVGVPPSLRLTPPWRRRRVRKERGGERENTYNGANVPLVDPAAAPFAFARQSGGGSKKHQRDLTGRIAEEKRGMGSIHEMLL